MSLKDLTEKDKASQAYGNSCITQGVPVYTSNGLSYSDYPKEDYKLVEKIEVLIKVLGTMIIIPEYETGEDFVKRYSGGVQRPILEGDNRDTAIKVMSELISQL